MLSDMFDSLFGTSNHMKSVETNAEELQVDKPTWNRGNYKSTIVDGNMVLDVAIPGVSPREITLWVSNTQVIVKGPINSEGKGTFTQRYTISADFDMSTTEASMADGMLRIRITKAPAAIHRRITIEFAGR